MPVHICECGAKCRFPDSTLGRRGKCPNCGAILTLTGIQPTDTIPIADESSVSEVTRAPFAAVTAAPRVESSPPIVETIGEPRGYTASVLEAFLFTKKFENLITFLFLWIGLAIFFGLLGFLSGIATLIGRLVAMFFTFVIYGWYAAYRFSIVVDTAGGNDDLPNLGGSREDFAEYAISAVKWVGTWVVVMAPAGIYMVISPSAIAGSTNDAPALTEGLFGFIAQASYSPICFILAVAGLAAWPLVVLCVALGGFGCLIHFQLLARTVIKTGYGYMLTVLLVLAAFGIEYALLVDMANWNMLNDASPVSRFFLTSFLALGIAIYFEIVAMKLIGLYYYHFKQKFAWDWG